MVRNTSIETIHFQINSGGASITKKDLKVWPKIHCRMSTPNIIPNILVKQDIAQNTSRNNTYSKPIPKKQISQRKIRT